jgi:polynucleotide 5'-kinase involved in rRNA processing
MVAAGQDEPHRIPHEEHVINTITGTVSGSSLQAAVVHGDVHLHQVPSAEPVLVPRQLVSPPDSFTNRASELVVLDGAISDADERLAPAMVLLCGPGGVGKTALAMQWAARTNNRFTDGQLFADLGDNTDAGPVDVTRVLGGFLRAHHLGGGVVDNDRDRPTR